jgi:hypothetical protein
MKFACGALGALVILTVSVAAAGAAPACDRACLTAQLDAYLAALVAHDPGRLHTSYHVKFTENGVRLPLGAAFWRTASALGSYRIVAADPETGQVGFLGTAREKGAPVVLALRLKVENKRLAEIETIVVRSPASARAIENMGAPSPLWTAEIAPKKRTPRAAMIARVNAYLDGVETADGDSVGFADDCNRIENGKQTTNNPAMSWTAYAAGRTAPGDDSARLFSLSCREELNTGMFNFITEARDRRVPIVDEERGIAMAFFIFVHPGDVKNPVSPKYGEIKLLAGNDRPFDTLLGEMFKIENGKIRRIEAGIYSGLYGSPTGWTEGRMH